MAVCKECGALLPMDYFALDKCQYCLNDPSEVDYTTDLNLYTFLEDCEDD